jgi:hypothetical protein
MELIRNVIIFKAPVSRGKLWRAAAGVFSVLLVAQLIVPGAALAQRRSLQPGKPTLSQETVAELRRIQKAALESDYAYSQVEHMTDGIGPRLSGSPQAQKAVEYVADEMRKLGSW